MPKNAKSIGRCPYCYSMMRVKKLYCESCEVTVGGDFEIPRLFRLKPEQLEFVERFVTVSGSLKEMAKELGISYPTVRSQLDQIIEIIEGEVSEEERRRSAVLDALENGRISADEATRLLKRVKSG